MRLNALLLVALGAIVAVSGPAVAQQSPRPTGAGAQGLPLVPGARVRIKATNLVAPLVANYLEMRGDTLVLFEESAGRGVWSFALGQVERLETTTGDKRGHRPYILRGAAYGFAGGAVAGLLFAASSSPSDPDREYSRPLTAFVGGALGAGIGALVGSRVVAEGWAPVPLPRRVSLAPDGRGGVRVGFGFQAPAPR